MVLVVGRYIIVIVINPGSRQEAVCQNVLPFHSSESKSKEWKGECTCLTSPLLLLSSLDARVASWPETVSCTTSASSCWQCWRRTCFVMTSCFVITKRYVVTWPYKIACLTTRNFTPNITWNAITHPCETRQSRCVSLRYSVTRERKFTWSCDVQLFFLCYAFL